MSRQDRLTAIGMDEGLASLTLTEDGTLIAKWIMNFINS